MDIYPDGMLAEGANMPGQTGMTMLTRVILRFGPTDGKHLDDILDCIKKRTPGGAYYPVIVAHGNIRKTFSPEEAKAHWDHHHTYYEEDGWRAKYDILIYFIPEQKVLLESCVCAVDDTLMKFLTIILDEAWGKAPKGTTLN